MREVPVPLKRHQSPDGIGGEPGCGHNARRSATFLLSHAVEERHQGISFESALDEYWWRLRVNSSRIPFRQQQSVRLRHLPSEGVALVRWSDSDGRGETPRY